MPVNGEVANEYGRVYRYIKPNGTDPGTYRLSAPETGTGVGGGGGGGGIQAHEIDGVEPIVAVSTGVENKRTTISLDIAALGSRVQI